MNLRILKKKSKQALAYKHHYGPDDREHYLAERYENYHGLEIRCKHKRGRFGCECHCPLKGTPMVGGMYGYYEPEWEERTIFEEMREFMFWNKRPATMTEKEHNRLKRILGITDAAIKAHKEWTKEYRFDEEETA